MITYSWEIIGMDRYAEYEGHPDIVFNVRYTRKGVDENGIEGSLAGSQVIQPKPPFVSYDALTKEDVEGWLNSLTDRLDSFDAAIAAQIAEKVQPTILSGDLPWTNLPSKN